MRFVSLVLIASMVVVGDGGGVRRKSADGRSVIDNAFRVRLNCTLPRHKRYEQKDRHRQDVVNSRADWKTYRHRDGHAKSYNLCVYQLPLPSSSRVHYCGYRPCANSRPNHRIATHRTRIVQPPKNNDNNHKNRQQHGRKPIYAGPAKNWIGPKFGCNCNANGSEILTCDITTGQCRCKPHYVGRTCDRCEDGYWNAGRACQRCDCDVDGSLTDRCDNASGRCRCKIGVGGDRCDDCLPDYYGFSTDGCKVCEPCNKPGHICNRTTGKCECPAYSLGDSCQHCTANTWGHEPYKGCKVCNCSVNGSVRQQCDLTAGTCACLQGYAGGRCERCDHGYYGYPKCKRCNCNVAGVDGTRGRCHVKSGLCQCDRHGNCPCKSNVEGRKCDRCKDGTFGLLAENPEGCTPCFCFGRSTKCTEAGLTWGQIRTNSVRVLNARFDDDDDGSSSSNNAQITADGGALKRIEVIPDAAAGLNVTMDLRRSNGPLYWKLDESFNGDRVLSYGGYLRFVTVAVNPMPGSRRVDARRPLVVLIGNNFELHHHEFVPANGKSDDDDEGDDVAELRRRHEVRLHESLWTDANSGHGGGAVTRKLLMIVLQSVESVYVKAGDHARFESLILQDVTLDTGIEIPGNPPPKATGVEICECPQQYNSSSCQNPSIGFYRHYAPRPTVNGTIIIDAYVGSAKKCHCNGRSSVCDIEDGRCLNCSHNTDGDYCERCAEGYYGNPMTPGGRCEPCPCPSIVQNFAKSCTKSIVYHQQQQQQQQQFQCQCKDGYQGVKCDACGRGYYGQPKRTGGSCVPCDCNRDGRVGVECDPISGQCRCKSGVAGKQCSQCTKPRHVLQNFTCQPCDNCTQWLLDDVESMSNRLHANTFHLQNGNLQPPWDPLNKIKRRHDNMRSKLTYRHESLKTARSLIDANRSIDYRNRTDAIRDRFETFKARFAAESNATATISRDTNDLIDELQTIQLQLADLTTMLDNFGKPIGTDNAEAVKDATRSLKDIERRRSELDAIGDDRALAECDRINEQSARVFGRPAIDTRALANRLVALKTKSIDLIDLTNRIDATLAETNAKNDANDERTARVAHLIAAIATEWRSVSDDFDDVQNQFDETARTLNDVERLHDRHADTNVDALLERLRDGQDDFDDELTALEEKASRAREHSAHLAKKAQEYKSLFNLTDKEIKTINATESYTDIVRTINESRAIVRHAADDLDRLLHVPEGNDNVSVQANILYGSSTRLLSRIDNLSNWLNGLEKTSRKVEKEMTDALDVHWNNALENSKQSKRLRAIDAELNESYADGIEADIERYRKISSDMKDVYKTAIDINRSKEIELDKRLRKLVNMTSNVDRFREHIGVARATINGLLVKNLTVPNVIDGQFAARNDELRRKLEKLKAEIAMSKHLVDEIKVSLTGSNCSRRYRVEGLEPSLVTKFTVSIDYKRPNGDSGERTLIFLGNSEQMARLSVADDGADGNVTFVMKLRNDVHRLKYKIAADEFYTFRVERIAGTLQMFVNNDLKQSLSMTNDKNVVFEVNERDLLHVGRPESGTRDNVGIAGCIKDIVFNDYKIGLWNFHDTQGNCDGCTRPPDTLVNSCKRFNGNGYSYLLEKHQKDYNPTEISLQFSIRTFDEEALVFLAVHLQDKTFMSATLKNGHVQFEVHYKHGDPLTLTSQFKYNNGKKVRVSLAKKYHNKADIANMRVEIDGREMENVARTRADVQRSEILKIRKCKFYFGGVTPEYTANYLHVTRALHTHRSLLGEIDEVMGHQAIALMDNGDATKGYHGITEMKCNQFSFREASFDGTGYLELKQRHLKKNVRLVFVVRARTNDSLLLAIGDRNETIRMKIANGRVATTLADGRTLNSAITVSDDYYHMVEMAKEGKSWSLWVDGTLQDGANSNVDIIRNARICIGGSPDDAQSRRFAGEVKDVFVNNELVAFDEHTIERFERVRIGRGAADRRRFKVRDRTTAGETKATISTSTSTTTTTTTTAKPVNLDSMQMKEMPEREDCGTNLNVLEANAAKFGDAANSYVTYVVHETFFKRDYSLEFDFRTFDNEGLLLYAKGAKGHHHALLVTNGRLALEVSGKRKKKLQVDEPLVSDGRWHNVHIEQVTNKRKRKLSIVVDRNMRTRKLVKIPQNKVGRELYVGGLPDSIKGPPSSVDRFKGCVRSFKINNVMQGLVNDKNVKHHNIGQCFPSIERGAYFRGDSYAVHSKYFRVKGMLELNFEFRTIERNGILLSVSNPGNAPAFSIELQNGAVVMSIDMGNGIVSNVTNHIQDLAVCNKWHKVIAIISSELTVNVDGVSKSWVLSDTVNDIEATLYIGGIPDYAPSGTLKVKENFNGCVRNLKIDDHMTDWKTMEKLNNVALDSCPVLAKSKT